ncbi:divalent-cation tolerance protein CutA [Candidatus Woesearchaeota archaeon]|jgi:periplasmic divalent cation tolerance protein|nr:divalent-cation tolerance protein CutA [Candidatus Woesearchaeota archaeon]MBT5272945.1 divalent-cation tolerance protein CutA [Candidatus Woesearchaeota archaeon]MBT6041411.1 divalent-cation tolerance protein CutA [Candidatus Woesearchaeota archaeon]MBT6337294.1 divalent-cation tolerance protein CutA [Candidatus Woesearchaeota archaeon]MBT7927171.1 divalent-cation tolerance protein CutA [Candidatus Woesearchaeota archaeon]
MKLLYITSKDKQEAKTIAKALVKEKLIACANIHEIDFVYGEKDKIEEGNEVVMIAKTSDELVYEAMEKVKSMHSYECPCILVLPVETANKEYVEWVNSVTKN